VEQDVGVVVGKLGGERGGEGNGKTPVELALLIERNVEERVGGHGGVKLLEDFGGLLPTTLGKDGAEFVGGRRAHQGTKNYYSAGAEVLPVLT
jgi:hypothetical protein